MKTLIVHLSDIHAKSDWDFTNTAEQIAYTINNHDSDKIVLAISGDLAAGGLKEEYSNFISFIDSINRFLAEYDRRIDKIVSVPGNHDILYKKEETRSRDVLLNMKDITYFEGLKEEYSKFENYYEFARINYLPSNIDDLCSTELPFVDTKCGKYKLRFYLYNNAVYTTFKSNDDSRGVIPLPKTYLDSVKNDQDTINILLMHFPLTFLDDYSQEQLKENLSRFSYVLCGHIHSDEHIEILSNTFMCPISIGSAINAVSTNPLGFSILTIDDETNSITKKNYHYKDNIFVSDSDDITSTIRIKSGNNYLQKNLEFNDSLQHASYDSSTLSLKDFYVFPDLQINIKDKKLKERIKTLNEFKEFLQKKKIVLINGYAQSGKTSLLNELFSDLDSIGMPVKLNYCSICEARDFEAYIKGMIEEEYDDEYAWDIFNSRNIKERIALIDDVPFDDSLIKHIEQLEQRFGLIVLTSTQSKYSESNLDKLACDKILKEKTSILSLRPMFYQKRLELIKRRYDAMVSFAKRNTNEREFTRVSNQVQMILNKYIGSDSRYPYFINKVICSVFDEKINLSGENQRLYSDIYEIYIGQIISRIFNNQDDTKISMNILQVIAREIISKEKLSISSSVLFGKVNNYLTEKDLTENADAFDIINKLVDGKILVKGSTGNTYAFASSDFLAYFVAKDISKNIDETNIKELHLIVNHYIDTSYIDVNEKVLLFLVSMRGKYLGKYILEKAKEYANEYGDIDITSEPFALNDSEDIALHPLSKKEKQLINEKKDNHESDNYDAKEERYKADVDTGKKYDVSERTKNYFKGMGLLNIISSLIPDLKTEIDSQEQVEYVATLYKLPQIICAINFSEISEDFDGVIKKLEEIFKEREYQITKEEIKEIVIDYCRATFLGCSDRAMMRAHTKLTENDLKKKEHVKNDTHRIFRLLSMMYDENPEQSFEKVSKEYFKHFSTNPFGRNCVSLIVRKYVAFLLPDGEARNKEDFLKFFFKDKDIIKSIINDGMLPKNS